MMAEQPHYEPSALAVAVAVAVAVSVAVAIVRDFASSGLGKQRSENAHDDTVSLKLGDTMGLRDSISSIGKKELHNLYMTLFTGHNKCIFTIR